MDERLSVFRVVISRWGFVGLVDWVLVKIFLKISRLWDFSFMRFLVFEMKLLALSSRIFPFNILQNKLWWLIDENDSSRVKKGKILINENSLKFSILDKKRKIDFYRIDKSFYSRMALGIEDCVKLTRQASNDNERMAILLLIGTNFKLLSHDHLRIILSSSTDPWRSTAWF